MTESLKQAKHYVSAFGCGICAGLLMLSVSSNADDISDLRATVFDYFDGINEVNLTRLHRAFSETAELKSVSESGELLVEPIAAAIDRWMKGEARERQGKILSIDLSGYPIARVVFDFDGAYVDFLTLAKLKGEWKIIDKVFVSSTSPCCEAGK